MHSIRIFGHYMRLPLLLLAAIEGGLVAASFLASFYLRYWIIGMAPPENPASLLGYMTLLAGVFVLSIASVGLYEATIREGLTGSLIRLLLAEVLGVIGLGALSFFLPQLEIWRSILVLTAALSFFVIGLLRLSVYVFKPTLFMRRVLVFGDVPTATRLMAQKSRGLDYIGVVPLATETACTIPVALPLIPHDRPLIEIVTHTNANEILLALGDRRGKLPMEELLDCRMAGISVLEPQSFFERELGIIKLSGLNPSWLVHADGFQKGAITLMIKRFFDILLSLIFLLVLGPVMLVAAYAIYVESGFRHSVFYIQTRIGLDGIPFRLFKFRSMVVDAESDGKARWATKNDPRITRVGLFIRKTRIDELPQIINILKGEMSFVGPRPERPEFVVELARKHHYYAARHRVKPGLTGWAQLCYSYGNTEEDALRKLEYDLYYIKNQSTFLDLLILLETVEVILFGRGAL